MATASDGTGAALLITGRKKSWGNGGDADFLCEGIRGFEDLGGDGMPLWLSPLLTSKTSLTCKAAFRILGLEIRGLEASATVSKKSNCSLCSTWTNCGLTATVRDGRVVGVEGTPEWPGSRGCLCVKGRALPEIVHSPDRLQYPQKRVGPRGGGQWERISWDEALDTIAGKLKEIKSTHGAEAVAFYYGYPKESRPFLHRLAHAFGSPNYVTASSTCFSATKLAALLTSGEFGLPDLSNTRCVLNWTQNPIVSNFINNRGIRSAQERGAKVIVVDPRKTPAAGQADLFLQIRPGTDGALALGMMNVIISEELYDAEFVGRWTVGFADLRELAKQYPPDEVERITGVPREGVVAAARLFASEKPACIRTSSCSTVHHTNGVQNHRAILLLSAITGNLDVKGGNVSAAAGWGNVPSGVPVKDISLHKESIGSMPPRVGQGRFPLFCDHYAESQGTALPDQILSGEPYPIKAVLGIAMNLMMWPNSPRMAEALRSLDFLVVTDLFPTPTTALADIVLPATTSLECEALVHYSTGHVFWREAVIPAVGESRPDWKLIFDLGERLGCGDLFWGGDLRKATNEIMAPSGMTVESLLQAGCLVQPPHTVKYRKYETDGFKTPSKKVELASSILPKYGYDALPVYREPMESPVSTPELAKRFPLVLTTGARKSMYVNSMLHNIPLLRAGVTRPEVDVHPADAAIRGIRQGDRVRLSTARGGVAMYANVTDTVPAGVVNALHGWAEADVNKIVDDRTPDPISGFPAYRSLLAEVTREEQENTGFCRGGETGGQDAAPHQRTG